MSRASLLGLVSLCGLVACASEQGGRAKDQLATVKRESNPHDLYERGRAFAAVGDFTRAEQYFSAAIDAGGDADRLISLIIYCCLQDDRYRLAAQYAEDHLRRRPTDHKTRFVLGTLYAGLGESEAAERELLRVVREQPEQAEARFALGSVLYEKNAALDADLQFREYLRLEPHGRHAAEAHERLLKSVPTEAPATGPAPSPLPQPSSPLPSP